MFDAILSYPTKFSFLNSLRIIQSPTFEDVAPRDLDFCLPISFSNPSLSISNPLSFAISLVKSKGKPKVSYSSNAFSPGIFLTFNFLITSSKRSRP